MDRGLDELISARPDNRNRGGRPRRRDPPRDNNRKSDRDVANLDDEWIHDKYEEDEERGSYHGSRRAPRSGPGRYRDRAEPDPFGRDRILDDQGTKIEIMNLHWDITKPDLENLVRDVGPTLAVTVHYDETNRSTGRAEVTFKYEEDARNAVADFDGANAKGQPIRVRLLTSGRGRNPMDRAMPASRSLLDRVDGPGRSDSGRRDSNRDRDRSRSPGAKRAELRANAREDIDRYVPDDRDGSRPRRRSPRRGGDRKDGRRGGGRGEGRGDNRRGERFDDQGHKIVGGRPRMTQEELDRDMDNYFNSAKTEGDPTGAVTVQATAPAAALDDDVDMAE